MSTIRPLLYNSNEPSNANLYLLPHIVKILANHHDKKQILDIGCGNGFLSKSIADLGFKVIAIDPSTSGIREGKKGSHSVLFLRTEVNRRLVKRLGKFPIVTSFEVIEHIYDPFVFTQSISDMLLPGGIAIVSAPYHGYFKNLAISIVGGWDKHFTVLWPGGHIKFWSISTISKLFSRYDMGLKKVVKVGRVSLLAKSMILVFEKSAR